MALTIAELARIESIELKLNEIQTYITNLVDKSTLRKLSVVRQKEITDLQTLTGVVGLTLDGLTDVDTSTTLPANGQVLVWDNADSTWEPGSASGWTDSVAGIVKLSDSADVVELGDEVDASALPTSAPATVGRLWNDSGTLKIS